MTRLERMIDQGTGREKADLVLKGGYFLDLVTGELVASDIAVCEDRIGNVREAAEAYRAYVRSGGRLDEPGVEVVADRVRSVLSQPFPLSVPFDLDTESIPASPQFDR